MTQLGARVLAVLALLVVLTACGGADAPPVPLPTFEAPETASVAAAEAGPAGPLPADCTRLMSADELTALMGRPLGSVALRTVHGVPEPDAGRTARLSCRYTASGAGGGAPLLTVNVARYVDPDAAARQWRLNSDAERAGRPSRDTPLGAAPAVLVERSESTALILAHADSTITLVLPAGPPVAGRAAGEVLVDLALRLIPRVVPPAPETGAEVADGGVRAA